MKDFWKIFRMTVGVLCLAGLVFSALRLYEIQAEYERGARAYEALSRQYVRPREPEEETGEKEAALEEGTDKKGPETAGDGPPIQVDFSALKENCKDAVAWLYCEGTPINYPVVQGGDNEYYLRRRPDGQWQYSGTLFLDYRNEKDFSSPNSIIYGHNMKDNSMFGCLTSYREPGFYEEHPVLWLFTEEAEYRIEVFAGLVVPASAKVYSFPQSAAGRQEFIDYAKRHSSFRADVDIREEDRLVTLSTCTYEYEDARYLLAGILEIHSKGSFFTD